MLIDARCHCHKFLCQISRDLIGVVRLVCPRCGKENDISLATVLRESKQERDIALELRTQEQAIQLLHSIGIVGPIGQVDSIHVDHKKVF